MTAIPRVVLLTVLAVASMPAVAAAQTTAIDSLTRRVVLLERQVADLEQRVAELESLLRIEPPPSRGAPALPNAGDVANWRRLGRGMKMDAVRTLLGEPAGVNTYSTFTIWNYPDGGRVEFGSDNKVDGWAEPWRSGPIDNN